MEKGKKRRRKKGERERGDGYEVGIEDATRHGGARLRVKSEPAWKEQQALLKKLLVGGDKEIRIWARPGPYDGIDRIRIAREEEARASNRCLCEWKG